MGSAVSKGGIVCLDTYDASATIVTGVFDKVDATAYNGDVLYQVLTPHNDWQPVDGMLLRGGLFKSTPGWSQVFPPGPTMVRFKRANAGVGAVVDVDIYAPDQSTY